VRTDDLAVGDVVLARPGERIAADGEVVEGAAAVDESLLTGESAPVERGAGSLVFGGSLVADDALVYRVTQRPRSSRLAQVAELVQRTLATRAPAQRLADRVSALLTAVAILVVACPCALGLATPLALSVALGRATRVGILVRNAAALDTAARIRRVTFDKTGTITEGSMSVVAPLWPQVPGWTGSSCSALRAPWKCAPRTPWRERSLPPALIRGSPRPSREAFGDLASAPDLRDAVSGASSDRPALPAPPPHLRSSARP
jgi:cation transport ATPase